MPENQNQNREFFFLVGVKIKCFVEKIKDRIASQPIMKIPYPSESEKKITDNQFQRKQKHKQVDKSSTPSKTHQN